MSNAIIPPVIPSPFWSDKVKVSENLLDALYRVQEVRTSNMKLIAKERLKEMCLTSEAYPTWGTKFGNFFEIVAVNA